MDVSGGNPYLENSPLIATSGRDLAAVWFDLGLEKLRGAVSRDGGVTWSGSVIQPGPTERIRAGGSTCIDGSGTAFCAAYGDDGTLGESIFVFSGSFDDASWQWRRRPNAIPYVLFDHDLDGVRILSDRSSDVLYLVYTFRPERYQGRVQFVRSTDAGASWSPPMELSGSQCNTAQLALGPDGELYVVWEDYVERAIIGRKSTDLGVSFGAPFTLGTIRDNLSFGPPGWDNPYSREVLDNVECMDFPAFLGVAVDTSNGPRRGTIYGVWSEYALGTVDPDPLRTVVETEPNGSFVNATPIQIGDDVSGAMVGSDVSSDNDVFTFEATAGTTIQITGSATYCQPVAGCMQPSFGIGLVCGDDPANLTPVGCGSLYDTSSIPPAIYTLPTSTRYYLGLVGSRGTFDYDLQIREYMVTPGEGAQDHRDVVLVRSTDGGATWSDKVRVNDDAPSYDNAMPAVTVDHNGRVYVAWYDRRDEPECSAQVQTYWTWSEDGGTRFAPSQRGSEQPSDGRSGVWQVGDHLALTADGDLTYLLWTHIPVGGEGEVLGVVIGDPIPGGINLSWDDCGAAGGAIKTFACDSNTGLPAVAVASFVPPPGIGQFLGASAELRIGTDGSTLPDWWRHGTGQCRGGTGLALAYTFSEGPFTCTEYGLGQAGGTHFYEVGYGGANRARLLVQYVVPKEDQGPLDPGTEYYAFRVNLLRTKTTGAGSCAGCDVPACIELQSLQIHQPQEQYYSPVLIQPLNRNFVSWQGPAWVCDVATPVLASLVSAEASAYEVRIVWQLQAPEAAVYRRSGTEDWALRARLTPDGLGRIGYVDRDVVPGEHYGYRLGVAAEGGEVYVAETEVTVPLAELAVRWLRRAGSGHGAVLMFTLASSEPASVEVYDVAGRKWGSRKLEGLSPGQHEVTVSGQQRPSPGVYFVRLAQGSRTTTARFPLP